MKKEKGKDRLKWNGSITDLKDFSILILKEDGKWQSRKQNGKTIHIFQQAKSKFKLTWWVSSKTFNIQGGNEKSIEKLQNKIDRLIQKREESILEENSNSKPAVKPKKISKKTVQRDQDHDKDYENYVSQELSKVWEAIGVIRESIFKNDVFNNQGNNRTETVTGRTDNRFEILSKESEENTL